MFHYRYIYKTVFGAKWQDLDAEDDEAADRIFWDGKIRDLNEIVMVSKSTLPVEEDGRSAPAKAMTNAFAVESASWRIVSMTTYFGRVRSNIFRRTSSHITGDSRPGGNRKRVKDLLSLLLNGEEKLVALVELARHLHLDEHLLLVMAAASRRSRARRCACGF